ERLLNREAPGGNWSGTLDFGAGTTNGFTTAGGNSGYAYANALLGNFNSWEIYNIFNHANFDDIDGTLTFGLVQNNPGGSGVACTVNMTRNTVAGNTCTFGTPTTARTPR